MAITVFAFITSGKSPKASRPRAPVAVSESGSVISSGACPATTGKDERGVATVTRPAPARKAAMPAMAGAPDFPREPPITST